MDSNESSNAPKNRYRKGIMAAALREEAVRHATCTQVELVLR